MPWPGFCGPHVPNVDVQPVDVAAAPKDDADAVGVGEHEHPEEPYSEPRRDDFRWRIAGKAMENG